MSNKKHIVMDGAVGTTLWDKTGESLPVWRFNIEHPEAVLEMHKEFIDAGSDMIFANTFGANPIAVEPSGYTVEQVVSEGVRLAKEAAAGTDVKVGIDAGPLTVLMQPKGSTRKLRKNMISAEDAYDQFYQQISAGIPMNPDFICLETFMDLNMMCVAVEAAQNYDLPIYCSMSYEQNGRTLFGNSVEQVVTTLEGMGVAAVGMNCSMGPAQAIPIIEEYGRIAKIPVFFKPNSGLPVLGEDGTVTHPYTPEMFINEIAPALSFTTYIGGCCGCSREYIRELRKAVDELSE